MPALLIVMAKSRREKIEEESDFYGAMDGASKFVRGDAIAGLIITAINIVVGLLLVLCNTTCRFLMRLKHLLFDCR